MDHQQTNQARTAEISRKDNLTHTKRPAPVSTSMYPSSRLQQTMGNQAILRLMNSGIVQPKLAVSMPGDLYESEADRVAEEVMRMPAPAVQRACASCAGGSPGCPECAAENEAMVQRKAESMDGPEAAPDDLMRNLDSGQPLDSTTRAFFEPRFGQDFSQVRIHTDAHASDSAREVNALAYTLGSNVVFGEGQYSPSTSDGQRLLAHELVHVVQQRGISG